MRTLAVLSLSAFAAVFAQTPASVDQAFLYLSDFEMKERICDQDQFVNYAGVVMREIESTIASMPESKPVSFGLILAVRKDRESKVWFSIKSGSLSEAQRSEIASSVEAIVAPVVNYGVVPIAYAVRAWGATDKITDIPVAPEWAEHDIRGMEAAEGIEKAWQ